MRQTVTLMGIALCVATLAQAAPGGNATPAATTVGLFVTQLAAAVEGEPQTFRSAQATLRRLGATGDFNPSAALTEGFVTRMAADLGVNVTGSSPATPVSAVRSAAIAGRLATFLEARPNFNDEGLPTACLNSANRGECVNCCKDTGANANSCAHFCVSNLPPHASEGEPAP